MIDIDYITQLAAALRAQGVTRLRHNGLEIELGPLSAPMAAISAATQPEIPSDLFDESEPGLPPFRFKTIES